MFNMNADLSRISYPPSNDAFTLVRTLDTYLLYVFCCLVRFPPLGFLNGTTHHFSDGYAVSAHIQWDLPPFASPGRHMNRGCFLAAQVHNQLSLNYAA